ncbi:MAG: sulfurtransferase TusA family protein [Thermodesulfovibrionia bacterium]|nr:sulfurtransferase TusA family protein [Thermodesulfovibrionia bacterium]
MDADRIVDCKGLNCPMPVIKTKKAIEEMQPGQIIRVEATDKGSLNDMPAFAKRTGNEIIGSSEENGVYIFYIKKA